MHQGNDTFLCDIFKKYLSLFRDFTGCLNFELAIVISLNEKDKDGFKFQKVAKFGAEY